MKNQLIFVSLFLLTTSFVSLAKDSARTKNTSSKNEKIIYKYKQYEKFDFDDIGVEGESGSPGDLSVSTRYSRDFKNKLPYRKNFNPEIHRSIERIR